MRSITEVRQHGERLGENAMVWQRVHMIAEPVLYLAVSACFLALAFQLAFLGAWALVFVFIAAGLTLFSRWKVRVIRAELVALANEIQVD